MIRYHVIPHSHWDREWYLSFDEFRGMLVNMIDDLVEILERDSDYRCFLLDGQTSVLDDYLEVRPERAEKIASLVAGKRLYVGPWYVLPDSFLVSGEALIRNLLKGTRRATDVGADRFIGYIPDSFGHIAQFPQIFRGFGIDTAIFWRGFGGEPGQEGSEYLWASPDGTTVLAEHLNDQGYSGAYFDSDDPAEIADRFESIRRRIDARTDATARLMLSGGDHHWPVPELPRVLESINAALADEAVAVHSNPIDFFDELKEAVAQQDLPTITGEQRFGYRWAFNVTGGVYSARMYLKQANAGCQRLLEKYLEPLNAIAVARGLPSQAPLIRHAWTTLMQNHPHDSICGCSIDHVHREMQTRFDKVANTGKAIERFLWQSLTDDREGTHGDDRHIAVFNPSPFARSESVECQIDLHLQDVIVGLNPDVVPEPETPRAGSIRITDTKGQTVDYELLDRTETMAISHTRYGYPAQSRVDRFTVRFWADDIPALGFASFKVERSVDKLSPSETPEGTDSEVRIKDDGVENGLLAVAVDERGAFWIEDMETGRQFGPLAVLEDTADAGDEYNYSPPVRDEVYRSDQLSDISIEWHEGRFQAGLTVSAVMRVPASLTDDLTGRSDESVDIPFRTTAWLSAGARSVSFETEIDNRAKDHRLRVLFETGCDSDVHFAESAFGVVERQQRDYDEAEFSIEVPTKVAPMRRFAIVEHDGRGATILSDGLPEYELALGSNGTVALTLLRCVGELSRGDLRMRPGGRAGWYLESTPEAQCEGFHRFRYGFLPHQPPWQDNYDTIERAAGSFLDPLRYTTLKRQTTPSLTPAMLTIETPGIVLSALKEAEDSGALILRTYNPTPDRIDGTIRFGSQPSRVEPVRLDETPSNEAGPAWDQSGPTPNTLLTDAWEAFEIKTYRIEF